MTTIGPGFIHVEPEEDRPCELCGSVEECRPYGPNGEQICYTCGQKDPETTRKMVIRAVNKAFELLEPERN